MRCIGSGKRLMVAAVAGLMLGAVWAAPASATTETFEYTGSPVTWVVPAGVTSATFSVSGAAGGDPPFQTTYPVGYPGRGGRARATIPVTPGESFVITVGGQGRPYAFGAGNNGYNGGGTGYLSGGGGASDVRHDGTGLNNRILVGGGGGGIGNQANSFGGNSSGGDGGGQVGSPGRSVDASVSPPGGGTQTAGGAAGDSSVQPGTFGQGGNSPVNGGGGGGGGWWGGGAGSGSGGGGGSGHGPLGALLLSGVRSGNGIAHVSYNVKDLSVSTDGTGSGYVDSAPAGIDCSGKVVGHNDCVAAYDTGSQVTLTAHPASLTEFAGFSSACSPVDGDPLKCTVSMDQARSVVATFNLERQKLEATTAGAGSGYISSSPTGLDCGRNIANRATCTAFYESGASVTLTPHPSTGSTFSWTQGCSGSGACTYSASQAKTVAGTFTLEDFTLSVTALGTGSGYVESTPAGVDCGQNAATHTDCSDPYAYDTSVTLTARPAANTDFTGWSGTGGCTGSSTTCTVSMTEARSVSATFTLKQRALSVTASGSGSGYVDSSPAGVDCGSGATHADCDESYADGTSVTLEAHPGANTDFTGWSGTGGCTGSSTTCTVSMTEARSVTASFTLKQRDLRVTTSGSGSGFVDSSPAGIDCGRNLAGHTGCSDSYTDGAKVTLTAHPSADSGFAGFTGAGCSAAATCEVTMDRARSVAAAFDLKPQPPPDQGRAPDSGRQPSSTSARDGVAPIITSARLSTPVFAVDPSASASAVKKGTKLSVRLNEPATVVFVTEQRVGRRWRKVRIFGRRLPAGRSVIDYGGKIKPRGKQRTLRPGRYRLRMRPSDRAGNKGKVSTISFTIVKG